VTSIKSLYSLDVVSREMTTTDTMAVLLCGLAATKYICSCGVGMTGVRE